MIAPNVRNPEDELLTDTIEVFFFLLLFFLLSLVNSNLSTGLDELKAECD